MKGQRVSLATSCIVGEARCPLTWSQFPCSRNHRREVLSWHWAIPPWGRGDISKVKQFLLLSPMHLNLYFFAPTAWWNFSTGLLDFHRGSVYGWLSKTVFYRGSWTVCNWEQLEPVCGPLQGTQPRLRSVCLLPEAQVDNIPPPGPLAYDVRSHSFHKSTFVHGWMLNCCWGEGYRQGMSYLATFPMYWLLLIRRYIALMWQWTYNLWVAVDEV